MSIPLPDGVSKSDFDSLIQDKYDGSTENQHLLRRDVALLAAGEPLAYVIGWIPFLGLRIYLDSHPLIPRPETEWWTEELTKEIAERSLRFLDLCAGSGAVGCAVLKTCSNAQVSFGELIPEYEATIRKNITENNLDEKRADVRIGDRFAPFANERFDIIACNPPYIPEARVLETNVTQFEPREALRAGTDGLDLIRRIAKEVSAHLNPGGQLWLECDISNIEEAKRLVIKGGARDAAIRTDLYGRPRIVVGYY